jgi:hypothetical protein
MGNSWIGQFLRQTEILERSRFFDRVLDMTKSFGYYAKYENNSL